MKEKDWPIRLRVFHGKLIPVTSMLSLTVNPVIKKPENQSLVKRGSVKFFLKNNIQILTCVYKV